MHLRQPVERGWPVFRDVHVTWTYRVRVGGLNETTPSHARRSRPREVVRSSTTLENVDPRPRLNPRVKSILSSKSGPFGHETKVKDTGGTTIVKSLRDECCLGVTLIASASFNSLLIQLPLIQLFRTTFSILLLASTARHCKYSSLF